MSKALRCAVPCHRKKPLAWLSKSPQPSKPRTPKASFTAHPPGRQSLDFGLAKWQQASDAAETAVNQTQDGAILGTAAYMSPEQAEGKPADARSDIFSFGLVLYEMLSGRRVFPGDSPISVMAAILHKDPQPLDAPPDPARIVARCLQKSPAARFQTMTELKAALEGAKFAPSAKPGLSIAVLPFANMSGDRDNEYFSDGLAEEILNALTKLPGLKVAARTSVFAFKGKNEYIRLIGEMLNVTHILEGSVRKAGTRVRVTGQLINISDGCHIWSDRYDHEMTDIFAIQDEISQAIVNALKLKLATPLLHSPSRRVIQPEAYEAYPKGRFFGNKRTEADLDVSIEHFRRAIELELTYALAHAGLSDAYALLGVLGAHAPVDVYPKAKTAAEKALALHESLAEAHGALAHVLMAYDWDFPKAEKEFRRALELNYSYSTGHQWYGHLLSFMGRHQEAIDEAMRARYVNPLSIPINAFVGLVYLKARQYDQAIHASQKGIELDPNHPFPRWILSRSLDAKSDLHESLAEAERAANLSGGTQAFIAQLGYAHARIGNAPKARQLLDQLQVLSQTKYVSPFDIALIYVGLGERDSAFEWLEKAFEERTARLLELPDPIFDSLRSDPRFEALIRRLGLPQ